MNTDFRTTLILLVLTSVILWLPAQAAPVRITGSLTSSYNQSYFGGGDGRASNWLNIATINANSYIWQPWFALVSGSLSFSTNDQRRNGSSTTEGSSTFGKVDLNLFPRSRFPFNFYASRSKSTINERINDQTTEKTVIGMEQSFRSRNGKHAYTGGIERNETRDFRGQNFISDKLSLSTRFNLEDHKLVNTLDLQTTESTDSTESKNYLLNARHSYTGISTINWQNSLNLAQSEFELIDTISETTANVFNSSVNWRPANRPDITMSGNLLISELDQRRRAISPNQNIDTSGVAEIPIINLNQGLLYQLNNHVSINQSLNINRTGSNDNTATTKNFNSGISYTSATTLTEFGPYSWNTAANMALLQDNESDISRSLSGSAGHSLSIDFNFNQDTRINTSFSQAFSYSSSSLGRDSSTISHSVNAYWTENTPKNNINIRFSASDSRTNDELGTNRQLLNLQVSDNYRFGRFSTLITTLTFQQSWTEDDNSNSNVQSLNGQVSYLRQRFLNVPTLTFNSVLKFSLQKNTDEQDLEQQPERDESSSNTNSWENKWLYRIGLFESRAQLDFVKNGNSYDKIIFIQFTRYFGA